MTLTDTLLALSDAYGAAATLSRSRVSTLIFNDGKALDRVAKGGDITTRSFERAARWFAANWPEGTPWPEGIERPQAAAEAAA